jgi:hypothetical protein
MAASSKRSVPQLGSLAELSEHVGEYPCSTGLLEAPVLRAALKGILGTDYDAYLDHMHFSGCGAIQRPGAFLLMDVSQLHVGGYSSLIFVRPSDGAVYVFWLRGTVAEKRYALYGVQPVPDEVRQTIVTEMNMAWGHVATFSWRGAILEINVRK